MANTIDELNFEVILSDAKFDAKIKEVENKAKQFNTSLSNILNINKISTQMSQKDVENARRVWQAKVDEQRAQEKINREKVKTEGLQRKINAQIDRATKGYNQQSRILQELKGYALGYLSIHGATQLLSSLVRVTGEFELQKTTLAAMLGDLNKAEQVITRIQGLAVESPFQFKELTTYAKQLSAFSVPAQELYDTTKMLADISAGLGVGMDRIVLAYGQVRSAAFLRGQEVRQFTEAGIPILDELAKQFSELEGRAVSTGEVFDKISARLVPFEMVAKVMKDLTSEGGKFYNMQEVQAETLRGKISNLKDAYEVMLNEIGSAHTEKLKGAVDMVRKMMQNYDELGKTIAATVITFGVARTAIELLSVAMGAMALKSVKVVQSLRNVQAFALKNPYVLIAAGITATGVALYRASTALKDYEKVQQSVVESKEKFNKAVNTEIAKLDTLYAKLRVAKKGTEEYDSAKKQIFSQYSGYISELKAEGVAVDNLATVYVNLKNKINEANKTRFLSSATEDIERTYGEGLDKLYKRFVLISQNIGDTIGRELMAVEKESLWQYILGDENALNLPEAEGIRGIVKDIYGGYGLVVERAQKDAKALSDAYTKGLADIQKAFDLAQRQQGQNAPKLVEGWRKTVQDTLTGMGLNKGTSFGLWAEDTTQSTSYVEDMIKRYKELGEEIKWVSSFDTDQAERLKKNKDAIEAIAKALKIDIKNLAANDSDTWESKEERRIKRLIETLRKLQDHYEKLKALGVSDDSIKKLFEGMFPELVQQQGKEFVTGLNYIDKAKTYIEELRKLNPEAADKLLVILNADGSSDYEKNLTTAIQATQKYYESMRKLASEDFNLEGKGITFDIAKIASDLSSKTNEIELNAIKLKETLSGIDLSDTNILMGVKDAFNKEFGEGSWDKFYQEYIEQGEEAIKKFASNQKAYEKKLAQEKINDLASGYVKELTQGINFSDWGDKNLSQIKKIGDSIVNLYNEIDQKGIKLSENQKESLKSLGLTTEDLIEAIKRLLSGNYQETTIERFKKIQEKSKQVVSVLGDASQVLTDLGNAVGNDFLVEFGNAVKSAEEFTNIILDCDALWEHMAENAKEIGQDLGSVAESKDWITMVVKVVLLGIQKITNAISQTSQFLEKQNELWMEYENIQREIQIKEHVSVFDTLFGKDALGELKANAEIAKGIIEEIRNLSMNATNGHGEKRFGWLETDPGWWASTFAGGGKIQKFQLDQLFEDNGLLSEEGFKKLKAYVDSGDLTKESKKLGNLLLDYYGKYNEATDAINGTINELFNTLATDVADNMISSFLRIGDATANLAEGFDNVREAIGRMILESALVSTMEPYVNQISESFQKFMLSGDTEELAKDMDFILSGMESLLDSEQWNELVDMLKERNLLGESMEALSDLGDGIKGITEDTANLLASYLNAIRADVSYARTIWERMDATTQRIATILVGFSAPSLMEYQAQIAANTYNTMLATQNILSRLDSVITYSDGPAGIRVYS